MKIIIFIILTSFPLLGVAQIETQISINKSKKEMTLVLMNRSDDTYKLSPKSIDQYEQKSGCIYSFCYKDKNGKIVHERSRFIYDELPSSQYRLGQFLLPHKSNEYKYDFKKWYGGEFHSIEVDVELQAINYKTKEICIRKIREIVLFK